jgi:hypothetical protein
MAYVVELLSIAAADSNHSIEFEFSFEGDYQQFRGSFVPEIMLRSSNTCSARKS